jgi:hypothetical protein
LFGDPSIRASKRTFAVVLRIQRCVEQLCKLVQGGSHGGRVLLGGVVVMAAWEELEQENKGSKTPENAAVVAGVIGGGSLQLLGGVWVGCICCVGQ